MNKLPCLFEYGVHQAEEEGASLGGWDERAESAWHATWVASLSRCIAYASKASAVAFVHKTSPRRHFGCRDR